MTIEELKRIIAKMPNNAEVVADGCETIKKVVAYLNDDGEIYAVNLEI